MSTLDPCHAGDGGGFHILTAPDSIATTTPTQKMTGIMPPIGAPPNVKRALLSVFDKTGLVEFAMGLADCGVELVASGGTAVTLRAAGVTVQDVADVTGYPEMLGGRVKTLHPAIHGGILARRDVDADLAELTQQAIDMVDLVVVNLYPFEESAADPTAGRTSVTEQIDIGGPAMIRVVQCITDAHILTICD